MIYAAITLFKRLLPEYEVEVLAEEFAVDAAFHVKLPVAQAEAFTQAVNSITNGQALVGDVVPDGERSKQ